MSGVIKMSNTEKDAIRLSENEVVYLRQHKIDTWPKLFEV